MDDGVAVREEEVEESGEVGEFAERRGAFVGYVKDVASELFCFGFVGGFEGAREEVVKL